MEPSIIPVQSKTRCQSSPTTFATTVVSPANPQITAPPVPDLVQQRRLQKRVDATCGFSSTDFFDCPVNSYCIYNDNWNRFGCCTLNAFTSAGTDCDIVQTTCYGSSMLAASSITTCPDYGGCCFERLFPDCLTFVITDYDVVYSSYACGVSSAEYIITPMELYQAGVGSTVTQTGPTVFVTPTPSTPTPTFTPVPDNTDDRSTWDQHKGAIIGGIVGGLVLIAAILGGLFIRHRVKVKRKEAGLGLAPGARVDDLTEISGHVRSPGSTTIGSANPWDRSSVAYSSVVPSVKG